MKTNAMAGRIWKFSMIPSRMLSRLIKMAILSVLALTPIIIRAQLATRQIVRLPLQLRESSGLRVSLPNRLWTHNDAGNTNQIYCFDTTGAIVRTITLSNIQNIDWEDITADPQGNFYINDAGNNDNNRHNLAIHILPNPDNNPSGTQQAQSINFQFPDQTAFPPPGNNRNFDIEAIVWRTDSIMMFTKNRSSPTNGYCKMYALKADAGQQFAVLRDSVFTGFTADDRVTAATLHPNGNMLVLLTRRGLIVFDQFEGNRFFRGRKTFLPFLMLPGQAEGLDFVDANTLFLTEEGSSNQGGYLYEIRLPQTLSVMHPNSPSRSCRVINNQLIIDSAEYSGDIISIFDQQGRLVYQTPITRIISLPPLPAGFYNVITLGPEPRFSCKIYVNKTE